MNAKSVRTTGLSRFRIANGQLSVMASDDYIGIFDVGSIDDASLAIDFVLDKAGLTELEKFARTNKKYDGELVFDDSYETLTYKVGEESISLKLPEFDERVAENYDVLELFIFDSEQFPATEAGYFALHPDRVAKLYRLKQVGDGAPIDMMFCETSGEPLVRFRYGETILGIIAPIRREVVDDSFLWTKHTEVSVS